MALDKKHIIENQLVEVLSATPELFLVQVKIDAKNNIKVFLDGDTGISIGQCTAVNRSLYPFIEENQLFPNDDFSLEVSSAGVDEPLLLPRQYTKNVGRELDVVLKDGTKFLGELLLVTDSGITIKVIIGKGKKAIIKEENIDFQHIKTAIVQVKF